jgi:phosphoglycolate phosphatase
MPPSSVPVAVIFDFDGTLANSRDAAWAAFQRVDRQLGLGIATAEAFYDLFVDSFHVALARACGEELAAKAWKRYAAILEAEYSPQLVPGMAGVVRDLAQESPLAVMSANTIAVVRRALEEAGVATCFGQAFCGEKLSKSEALKRFLADPGSACKRGCADAYEETCSAAPELHRTVLITDTTGDIQQARTVGVHTIGVSWGMHDTAALLGAGAETVVVWPQEIPAAVGRLPGAALDAVQAACEAADRRRATVRHGGGESTRSRWPSSDKRRVTTGYHLAGSIAPLMRSAGGDAGAGRAKTDAEPSRQVDEEWVMAVESEVAV